MNQTTAAASPAFNLRQARATDCKAIVGLICELADFEMLSHLVKVSPQSLEEQLFGDHPAAEAVVAEVGDKVVGFALFFTNFSTFLGKPGLYLEDLYVQADQRQHGIGKALLQHLGALAVQRGYGRFEWSVLDWNANAIDFYKKMGAEVMPEWRICRIAGDTLQSYARP